MKNFLLCSILFGVFTLSAFGELIPQDLEKIRSLIQEENKPIKDDIVSIKIDTSWIKGKLEGIEKQVTHSTNITYGLIALIVAAIGIPQIIIASRSAKTSEQDKKIEELTKKIESMQDNRIVNP